MLTKAGYLQVTFAQVNAITRLMRLMRPLCLSIIFFPLSLSLPRVHVLILTHKQTRVRVKVKVISSVFSHQFGGGGGGGGSGADDVVNGSVAVTFSSEIGSPFD